MADVSFINQTQENVDRKASQMLDFSKVYSIKDLKSENFGHLLVANTEEEAIRACKIRLIYDQGSLLQQFPADYMLYYVGDFNQKSGVMRGFDIAFPVVSLLDVSKEIENEQRNRKVEIPSFMEGDEKNAVGSEESGTVECAENCGQSA